MNARAVIAKLHKLYPGKTMVKNDEKNPTEIICEIEPTSEHAGYSVAIAVIDQSIPHFHKQATEEYEVINGKLTITINGHRHVLKPGEKLAINPGHVHFAKGNETWVKVTARPGWKPEDHLSPIDHPQKPRYHGTDELI